MRENEQNDEPLVPPESSSTGDIGSVEPVVLPSGRHAYSCPCSRCGERRVEEQFYVRWANADDREEAWLERVVAGAGIGPWAQDLVDLDAGLELFCAVTGIEVGEADPASLLEMVAGCERLIAMLAATQARVLGELLERRRGGGVSSGAGGLADEVAACLSITGYAAGNLVHRATALADAPEVHDALTAGSIDARKADLLLARTATLAPDEAWDVREGLVPLAGELTVPQLRGRIDRAVLAADPATAARRHAAAVRTRGVSLTAAEDGMAWLSAYLPATDAVRCFTAVDTLAGGPRAGDARTVGNRRADALVEACQDALAAAVGPHGRPVRTRQGMQPTIFVTVAASTLAGADEVPADLAGYGPISADTARTLASGACRHRMIATDPVTGAYRCGADATSPSPVTGTTTVLPDPDELDTPSPPPPERPTSTSGTAPDAPQQHTRHQDPAHGVTRPPADPPARQDPGQPPATQTTAAAARGEDPRTWDAHALIRYVHTALAEERGGGASTDGATARTHARRPAMLLSEELGLLAVDSYAPTARLRRHITERDRTCRFPGCRQPAWRCQLDHITPFDENLPAWAQTTETNLHALCAHHHQAKTSGRWLVSRDPVTGATTWTAPTGHTYTRPPETLRHVEVHQLATRAAPEPPDDHDNTETGDNRHWHGDTPGQHPHWDEDEIHAYLTREDPCEASCCTTHPPRPPVAVTAQARAPMLDDDPGADPPF